MIHKLQRVLREDMRPWRRIASRLLLRLPCGLTRSRRLKVRDYQIYLHRSSMASEFWYDANARGDDYDFITLYLRPEDVYIDVGANIGTTVIPAAMRLTAGRALAFEPHPRIYSYLRENLELNGLTNVEARNSAVGSQPGTIWLSDNRADDMNHVTAQRGTVEVAVEPLDEVTKGIGRIALIKVDVEGYEKHVFDGGPHTLAKTDCVYFELCEVYAQRFGVPIARLLTTLEEHGFHLFRKPQPKQLEAVPRDYRPKVHHENAFAIRDVGAFLQRTGWRVAA